MSKVYSPVEMFEILSRIKAINKLYQAELNGHIEILLCGDFKLSDKIFNERQALDRKIFAVLSSQEKEAET